MSHEHCSPKAAILKEQNPVLSNKLLHRFPTYRRVGGQGVGQRLPIWFPRCAHRYWDEGPGTWTGAFWQDGLLSLPHSVFDVELGW